MIQLLFAEVRVPALADHPVLVLKEAAGSRRLAIWVTASAAAAVLSALEAEDPHHPNTHDLLIEALSTQDALVEAVHIVAEKDGVFDAQLLVNGTAVTCRVSDGVALALRCGAPILASEDVLHDVGLPGEPAEGPGEDERDEVEQFREFLANVNADDFDEPQQGP